MGDAAVVASLALTHAMSPKAQVSQVPSYHCLVPLHDSNLQNTSSQTRTDAATHLTVRPITRQPRATPRPTSRDDERSNRCKVRQMKRLEEYRKLKAIVPSLKSLRRAKKVTIINEAVKYIDKLHADLLEKVMQGKIPGLSHLNLHHVNRELVLQSMTSGTK